MNYEQEYKKALERARIWQKHLNESGDKDYAEELSYIFSELKKEENERIRKAIIALVKQSSEILAEQNQNNMIAWLENQELKCNPYSGVYFQHNNHTWGMCARDGGVEIAMDGNLKAFVSSDKSFVYPTNPIPDIKPKSALEAVREEKVDNQNCAVDNVKSKFKAGDWIISLENGCVYQVIEVKRDIYVIRNIYNKEFKIGIEACERTGRLWKLSDARDGEVLVDKYNNIGIFQECEGICWHSHIYRGCNGELQGFNIGGSHEQIDTYPATKEQRDALCKAMAEAGYEFDFKKKKLEKIEQKPQRIISAEAKEALYGKPAWSEEDTFMYNKIKNLLIDISLAPESRNSLFDWLKSLKDRYTWKPSEEQMEALTWALSLAKNCGEECAFDLRTLHEQLEKLK